MAKTYGLIVGSGWESLSGDDHGTQVDTAFGTPSANVLRWRFGSRNVLSLCRHGAGHTLPPHAINYRANILALKKLGADAIVGLNTVGVITPNVSPGTLAVPNQLLDYTWGRQQTLFDGQRGIVEHVDFSRCARNCWRPLDGPALSATMAASMRPRRDRDSRRRPKLTDSNATAPISSA